MIVSKRFNQANIADGLLLKGTDISQSQLMGLKAYICRNPTHKVCSELEPQNADQDQHYQQPFADRHQVCQVIRRRSLELSILGVCHQLYREGIYAFWATNTFIFDNSAALDAFTKVMNLPSNAHIRRNMRNICLSATIAEVRQDSFLQSIGCLTLSVDRNIAKPYITTFEHIKTLEIWADYLPGTRTAVAAGQEGSRARRETLEQKEQPLRDALAMLEPFRQLRLSRARLVITDDAEDQYEKLGIVSERLTCLEKNQLAEDCGQILLEHQGAIG